MTGRGLGDASRYRCQPAPDLEFLNSTLIYSGRWIGAGWFHPIEELAEDSNKTPPD